MAKFEVERPRSVSDSAPPGAVAPGASVTANGTATAASPIAEHTPDDAAKQRTAFRLQMPVDVRSASVALIALILSLYALQWAKEVLVPILGGVMLSYALAPIVDRLERLHVHRVAASAALLSAIVAVLCWGTWSLSDEADAFIETLPSVTAKIRTLVNRDGGHPSTIDRVQQAATELAATAAASEASSSASGVDGQPTAASSARASRSKSNSGASPAVAGAEPAVHFDVRSYLFTGTLGVISFLGQLTVILFLALFLLSSGDNFRRKMVKLAGPKLSQKKVTIETLDEITDQIQRYLLVQVGVSLVVGLCTWLAFMWLGLHNAGVWGVVASVTNLIPYVGAVAVGCASAIIALVQFGTPGMAIATGATSFAIHMVIGNVLTPWWMGKASKMSAVAVFISVLMFGWLWGVWGLLLGVPILLVIKSVCDRVEDLKPVGELLGE